MGTATIGFGNSHGNLFLDICSPVLHLRVPRRKYKGRVEKIHWLLHWQQMESQSFKTFFKVQLLSTSRLYTKLTCDLGFSLSCSLDSVHTMRRERSKVLTCHWWVKELASGGMLMSGKRDVSYNSKVVYANKNNWLIFSSRELQKQDYNPCVQRSLIQQGSSRPLCWLRCCG